MHKPSTTILLIRNAAKQDFGGAETYQISLATTLVKNDLTPIIITRSQKLLDKARANGIPTVRGWWWSKQNWNGKNVPLFPLYLTWQCILTAWYISLIIRTKPLALHIQSKDDFIAATFAGAIMRRAVVWTDHMDLRYIFENITKPFRNPLGKLIFFAAKFSSSIILISRNEKRLVTGHFKRPSDLQDRIVLVHNGVIDRLGSQSASDTRDPFVHLCLASRIVTNKGIGEAIDAFSSLDPAVSKRAVLDIYGEGPEREHFEASARRIKGIQFHGHQDDALKKIYQSDVFILPSYQEGFSIALLEATMLGKAIIATDVDSNGEIISDGKTGLLVLAKDSQALAHAMTRLIQEPHLRETLGTASRQKYEQHFNLDQIVKQKIIPLYKQS